LNTVFQDYETAVLISWQTHFGPSYDNGLFFKFLDLIIYVTDNRFTMGVAMFMYLASDTYIAFKTALLYFVGLYIIIILKLIYISPRPYWIDEDI